MKRYEEVSNVGQQQLHMTTVYARFTNEIISAAVVTAIYALVAWWYYWPQIFSIIVFVVSLALLRFRVYLLLVWAIETWLGRDLSGDGVIGDTPTPPNTTRPVISKNGVKGTTAVEVHAPTGLTQAEWAQVAQAVRRNAPVSRRGLAKNSGLTQSRAALAANLLQRGGLAEGNVLTPAGRAWLNSKLPHPTPKPVQNSGLTGSPTNQTS
jgi:hypothetical protein